MNERISSTMAKKQIAFMRLAGLPIKLVVDSESSLDLEHYDENIMYLRVMVIGTSIKINKNHWINYCLLIIEFDDGLNIKLQCYFTNPLFKLELWNYSGWLND